MDDLMAVIRSVLLSSKNGVRLQDLNRDFKMIEGENIPFRQHGFKSLDDLFSKVPGIKFYRRGGDMIVEAIPTEESAHIVKMINSQKETSKRKRNVQQRRYLPPRQNQTRMPIYRPQITNNKTSNYTQLNQSSRIVETPRARPAAALPRQPAPSNPVTAKSLPVNAQNGTVSNRPRPVNGGVAHRLNLTKVQEQTPPIAPLPTKNLHSEPITPSSPIPPLLSLRLSTPVTNGYQSSPLHSLPTPPPTPTPTPTSTPKVSFATPKPTPKQSKKNAIQDLLTLTINRGLPEPVYKIRENKHKVVYAQVQIGPRKYSSYPNETVNPDEAQNFAANLALKDLNAEIENAKNLVMTRDRKVVEQRILKIVKSHPYGVVKQGAITYYEEEYKEKLPDDWLEIVEAQIMLEKGASNSTILLAKKDCIGKPLEEEMTNLKIDNKIVMSPMGIFEPGVLKLPDAVYWVVYIINAVSTTDIWANIVGEEYSDKLQALAADMSEYYTINGTPAEQITVGNYYTLYDDQSWHRVRCVYYDEKIQEVEVFFIDRGENESFSANRLCKLEHRFMCLPAQAMRLAVSGLEVFVDCEDVAPILDSLYGGLTLNAQVIKKCEDELGPYVSMHFYDSNGTEDVLLDDLLLNEILLNVVDIPRLDKVKGPIEVYVSEICEGGELYIQILGKSLHYMKKLMEQLLEKYSDEELKERSKPAVELDETYLVKYPVDGKYYRGKVLKTESEVFDVFFMDIGRTRTIDKNHIFSLKGVADILALYPPQAVKVQLHKISPLMFDENMKSRLLELASPTQALLMKIVDTKNNPVIELFKRVQPQNLIISINDTIIYDKEMQPNDDANNNVKQTRRKFNHSVARFSQYNMNLECSGKSLEPPKIPPVGDYFDVHVTMAANPGNFTVQPHDDFEKLNLMMAKLQTVCAAYNGPPIQSKMMLKRSLYAGKYDDGLWYRVCISNVINESIVTVYFCDYGDFAVLDAKKLQPLKDEFLERPYEAVKAKLVGISPVNGDWSVEDCLRFQSLVVERNFVSLIIENALDRSSPGDTILGLKLIDTSTDKDIDIAQVLVSEGRAFVTSTPGDETNNN